MTRIARSRCESTSGKTNALDSKAVPLCDGMGNITHNSFHYTSPNTLSQDIRDMPWQHKN